MKNISNFDTRPIYSNITPENMLRNRVNNYNPVLNASTLFPKNNASLFPSDNASLFPSNNASLFPSNKVSLFPSNDPYLIKPNYNLSPEFKANQP
jgi:hypothetical protein